MTAPVRRLRDGRFLRGVVVGILATLVALGAVSGWAWNRARPTACVDLPREDLSLREMGQLRRRIDAYKHSMRPSPLILSGREASFLLREEFDLPAWLAIEGSEVRLQAQVEESGRCWSLGFRGRVELEHRRLRIRPSELTVGRLALSWLAAGRTFEVAVPVRAPEPPPEGTPGPEARLKELAAHLMTMQVADGSVFVRIDDRGWIR